MLKVGLKFIKNILVKQIYLQLIKIFLTCMCIEGGFNAVSGALSVLGGYLGGMAGFHNTVFTKLLSQKGDFWLRLLVENVFTVGFKLTNGLIKPYLMI